MMLYSQYLRIESRAGGVAASPRDMIRVARKMLTKKARRGYNRREARHNWYRAILNYHADARQEYASLRLAKHVKGAY